MKKVSLLSILIATAVVIIKDIKEDAISHLYDEGILF